MVTMKAALDTFTSFTGMEINQQKSGLELSVSCNPQLRRECKDALDVAMVAFLIRYLGLPLALGKLKYVDCNRLIASLEKALSRWWVAKLSYAGRVQLLNWSIQGRVNYWLESTRLLKETLKQIQ